MDIQPPDTVVLNLPPLSVPDGEARLLDAMKPKWRYNIKLGPKKGLKVDCYEGDSAIQTGLQIFWTLYLETAERDGIALHDKRYYQDLFTHAAAFENTGFDKKRSVRVYIASHEGSPLAAIVTLFCGDEAVYLYGASSNEKRNLMPAYALQWQAIRDARDFDAHGMISTAYLRQTTKLIRCTAYIVSRLDSAEQLFIGAAASTIPAMRYITMPADQPKYSARFGSKK